MYIKVHKKLYEKNKDLFIKNIGNMDNCSINANPFINGSYKLSDNIYIYTNLNSNAKLKYVRILTKIFGETDYISFLVNNKKQKK